MTHICVSKLTIIGSDNGLLPERHQAIIWTNAGILLIGTLGRNCSEILSEIHTFSFKKMHLKTSVEWRPFCLGINVLTTSRQPVFQWISKIRIDERVPILGSQYDSPFTAAKLQELIFLWWMSKNFQKELPEACHLVIKPHSGSNYLLKVLLQCRGLLRLIR